MILILFVRSYFATRTPLRSHLDQLVNYNSSVNKMPSSDRTRVIAELRWMGKKCGMMAREAAIGLAIASSDNPADMMTKCVPKDAFFRHRDVLLGLAPPPEPTQHGSSAELTCPHHRAIHLPDRRKSGTTSSK